MGVSIVSVLDFIYYKDYIAARGDTTFGRNFGYDPFDTKDHYLAGHIYHKSNIDIPSETQFQMFELTDFHLTFNGLWKRWLLHRDPAYADYQKFLKPIPDPE